MAGALLLAYAVAFPAPVQAQTASTDAALSALELTDGYGGSAFDLDPAFVPTTRFYYVRVENGVNEITVVPTQAANATYVIQGKGAVELDDADDVEDGFQVALAVGDTEIRVLVTAEDGVTTRFYRVDVSRALARPLVLPIEGLTMVLDVIWTAPADTTVVSYDMRYRAGGSGSFIDGPQNVTTGSRKRIQGLRPNTSYQVQVRMTTDRGDSEWSPSGRASTHPPEVPVPDDWSLKPSGLAAGAKFRLLYVSHDGRGNNHGLPAYNDWARWYAGSGRAHADIQTYAPGFRVVGCSRQVNARLNTGTQWSASDRGVPIHWLGGAIAADDYGDLYDGTWQNEDAATTEAGALHAFDDLVSISTGKLVWSGCESNGNSHSSRGFGDTATTVGRLDGAGGPLRLAGIDQIGGSLPIYGLSQVFVVRALSTYAGLTALALTDGDGNTVGLGPTFSPGTTSYQAAVEIGVNEITVVATPHGSATYEIQDTSGAALEDANDVADGFQVALDQSFGAFQVEVTAADTTSKETYTVMVSPAPPVIVNNGVRPTSSPGSTSDTYGLGETIEITATFDHAVTVDTTNGTPRILFVLNGTGTGLFRWAEYSRGSGGKNLVFTYVVQPGDSDTDGIWLRENGLELRGGTISAAAADTIDATLTYPGPGTRGGHKVDASLTTYTDATLSALTVNDGTSDHTIDLAAPPYAQTVGNGVTALTLTATPTHTDASVSAVTLRGAEIADTVFTDGITIPLLLVGDNAIEVTVTAEDGSTRTTYMVTVTRETATSADLLWTTTVTVGESTNGARGYDGGDNSSLEPSSSSSFNFGGNNYGVSYLLVYSDSGLNYPEALRFLLTRSLPNSSNYTLEFAGETLPLSQKTDGAGGDFRFNATWVAANAPSLSQANFRTTLAVGNKVKACLRATTATLACPADDPARAIGKPAITGTAHVGQTLTADTSAITDTDGVPATFTYQWVRVDAMGTPWDIGTDSTYTPVAADVGSTIRVYVSFTDNAGNAEGPLVSDATAAVEVAVTIEAEYGSIGAGVEPLKFTLTREGDASEALTAKVTIHQDESWLASSDLEHEVTFLAGEPTATLTIPAVNFSLTPSSSDDLTAIVSGDGISGGEYSVLIISIAEPPFTVTFDMPEYTFAEHENTEIYIVSTLNAAYPRKPSRTFFLSYSTRSDTAASPHDFPSSSLQTLIANRLYAYDDEIGSFVARRRYTAQGGGTFAIIDDDLYEGQERFGLVIQQSPGYPQGLAQIQLPNGTKCEASNCPDNRFWVTITDDDDLPELLLSADPALIAEEDDDGTTDTAENATTVTVEITNGKTFAKEQAVTLTFSGTAIEGTHYSVSPADADTNTAGYQVMLPADNDDDADDSDSSVDVTVTAIGNDTEDGDVTLTVTGDFDGTDLGATDITIRDEDDTTTTDLPWSTTMMVGQSTGDNIGFFSTDGVGTLDDADFTVLGVDYTVEWVNVGPTKGVNFQLSGSPNLSNPDDYVLEVAGVQLPLDDSDELTSGNNAWRWLPTWLAANASSLDADNYDTTVSLGTDVTVCLRTADLVCPGGDNSPASGPPTISGVPQVDNTLTVDTSPIKDANGLPSSFDDYQWVRIAENGTETTIVGATAATYPLVAADAGSTIRVDVSFTDLAGFPEMLSSVAVGPVLPAADCADRSDSNWCTTMTVGVESGPAGTSTGFGGSIGSLGNDAIDYGTRPSNRVEGLGIQGFTGFFQVKINLVANVPRGTVFNFGGTEFTADVDSEQGTSGQYAWDLPANFGWIEGQYVTVSANLAPDAESATVDGTTLVLTHSENLDTGSTPAAGQYVVNVDGSAGPDVSSVSVGATTVTLTLETAVAATDTNVTVDYTMPTSNPLQDESGLDAPDSTTAVTNNTAGITDLPWSTTMTVAQGTATQRGYNGTNFGSLDDDDFTLGTVAYDVTKLMHKSNKVRFALSEALSDKDDYILELAGEELPLSASTTLQNRFFDWSDTWLAANASSLSFANYETTLAVNGRVDVCLRTTVQTCPGGTTLSSDATLSALTVNDGTTDHTIDLATTPYTVTVANGVETVTLTAPPATGAVVTAVTLGGNTIADTDFSDGITVPNLAVGANTIVVTVTAEDGTTTQTYTVTVTQNAATSSDLPWSTTMTVGQGTGTHIGYESRTTPVAGSLGDNDFTVSGTDYVVRYLKVSTNKGATLSFDTDLSNRGDYILEWAGVVLPLSETGSGVGAFFQWDQNWLATNAPSLSTADYATTLPVGTDVKVCLRTTTQVCPGGTVTNNPPVFADPNPRTLTVRENSPLGTNIGDPVAATDPEDDTLTYSLDPNPSYVFTNRFQIDAATGQLKVNHLFDHELHVNTQGVVVIADDNKGGTADIVVAVTVVDVDEPPDVPRELTVTGFGTTSLQVEWRAPASNVGRPDIESYKVEYREAGTMDPWIDVPQNDLVLGLELETTISPVDSATSYEVRVRTVNDEGDSPWVYSDVPVPVTIEAEHDVIGGGLEDLNFTLTRTGDTTEELVATVTITQDQTWLSNLSHAVTFAAGDATATLSIGASNFSLTPTTTGNLTATVSGAGISGGSDTVQVVSIADPPITVGYDMSAYIFEEDTTDEEVYFVATLNTAYPRAPSRNFGVGGKFGVSTQSGTARFRDDFEPVNTTVELRATDFQLVDGQYVARERITGFDILDDDVYEVSEQFLLKLEKSTHTNLQLFRFRKPDGTGNEQTPYDVTITDDEDLPALSLSVDPSSIAEEDDDSTTAIAENASTVTVGITNGKTFVGEETVTLTFSGTATLGTHYNVSPADADGNAVGHQVLLPAETASVPVTVTATANDSADGNVTVTVAGDLDGTAIGARDITILDDDTAITNTPATGAPGITGTAQVGQELTATLGGMADADDLPATFPDDYTFQWVRLDSSNNVTNVGTNSGAYTVMPADVGGTIRVDVSFTDAAGNPEGPLPSAAVGPVLALPVLSFAETQLGVNETDGTAVLTVNLAPASTGMVTVDYATDESSAKAGKDYTAQSGTLEFAAGETSKTITIQITDDDIHESDVESFDVELTNPSGATVTDGLATIFITSDDAKPVASMEDVTVSEGAGTMTLVLDLDRPSSENILYFVHLQGVGGTATVSDDYVDFSNVSITVPAGERSAEFDITIIDDSVAESTETITIAWIGSDSSLATPDVLNFTGTITDDDDLPVLSFAETRLDVDETDGTVELTVNLAPASTGMVTVDYATVDRGAKAGEDYTAQDGTLEFTAGETSKTITVQITDDDIHEPEESFRVELTNPSGATVPDGLVRVYITSDDAEPVASMDAVTVGEGASTMTLVLKLDRPSSGEIGYFLFPENVGGTATASEDYADFLGTENITVPAGERSAEFDITIIDDNLAESNETITIGWRKGSNSPVTPDILNFTGTITDDDGVTDDTGENGDHRLAPSDDDPHSGRLEVKFRGEWGTVCDDRFDSRFRDPKVNANVPNIAGALACQAMGLGYETGEMVPRESLDMTALPDVKKGESGYVPIWLDDVRCSEATHGDGSVDGKVSGLQGCYHAGIGLHNCRNLDGSPNHDEDVYLRCIPKDTARTALTAKFLDLPVEPHSGEEFSFRIEFSEPVLALDGQDLINGPLVLTGAQPVRVALVDNRYDLLEVTVDPVEGQEVTIGLESGHPCWRRGGSLPATVCTRQLYTPDGAMSDAGDPLPLSQSVSETVEAKPLLTGDFMFVPPSHDGENVVGVRVVFSEPLAPGFTLDAPTGGRDVSSGVLDVSNARIVSILQATSGNATYVIELEPIDGGDPVGIELVAGHPCNLAVAACTPDGRKLRRGDSDVIPYSAGAGSRQTPLSAKFAGMPAEHGGAAQSSIAGRAVAASPEFTFTVRFSEAFPISYVTMRDHVFTVTNGRVTRAQRLDNPHNEQEGLQANQEWEITVAPDAGGGDVTITLPETTSCNASGAVCTGDGLKLSNTESATVAGPPSLSIADAQVQEAAAATLEFTVSLNRAASATVTVDWATADGTATAGSDYTADFDILTFAPGETAKTVSVAVLDDSHDEGGEMLTVTLSNPSGAYLADAEATGTINNSDPMPAAWLTRFGRTASDHVVDAIAERWRGGEIQTQQTHFTLGGRNVDKQFGRRDDDDGMLESSGAGPGDPALEDESAWARMDRFKAGALAGPESVGLAGGNAAGGNATGSGLKGAGAAGRSPAGRSPAGHSASSGRSPAGGGLGGEGLAGRGPAGGGLGGEGLAGRGPAGGGTSGGAAARSALMNSLGLPSGNLRDVLMGSLGLPSGNLRDVLMGSSFFYSRTLEGNGEQPVQPGWLGQWSAWGRTAATQFSGADGALSLNGEVATAILGADARRGRWLMGVTLSRSEGDGVYTHPAAAGGAVSSTLTSLNPYVHYRLSERTSLWGVAGYGVGGLKLTLDGSETGIETDLATAMAAFGGRGVFSVRTSRLGAYELAVVSDVRVNRTESDSVENLMGAAGATSRVRVMLEGAGSMPLATGGVLTPTLEAGLRYDGGDAETGGGLEVGAGLGYAAGALAVEVKGRMLLAHEATDYDEQGFSGSIRYEPRPDGRGLSINLGSAWGATQSGVQSLWSQQDASGLARGGAMNAGQRFQAELGYGIAGRGRADALWIPFLGAEMGDGGAQSLRMGVTYTSEPNVEAGLELGQLENGQGEREHAVLLRGTLRW